MTIVVMSVKGCLLSDIMCYFMLVITKYNITDQQADTVWHVHCNGYSNTIQGKFSLTHVFLVQ